MLKCRTCLTECEKEYSVNIFTKMDISPEVNTLIADVLTEIAHIQASPEDSYPNNICTKCCGRLRDAQSFIIKAQESERLMKNGLNPETLNQTVINKLNLLSKSFDTNTDIVDVDHEKTESHLPNPSVDSDAPKSTQSIPALPTSCENIILNEEHANEDIHISLSCESTLENNPIADDPLDNDVINCDEDMEIKKEQLLQDFEIKQEPYAEQEYESDLKQNYYIEDESFSGMSTQIKIEPLSEDAALKIHRQSTYHEVPIEIDIPDPYNEACVPDEDVKPTLAELTEYSEPPSVVSPKKPPETMFNKCEICDKTFQTAYTKWLHAAVHESAKMVPEVCMLCSKDFKSVGALKRHVLSQHSYCKKYTCALCSSSFESAESLALHMKVHPPMQIRFSCPVCKKKNFKLQKHVKSHIMRYHVNAITQSEHKCDICEREFLNRAAVLSHVRHCCTGSGMLKNGQSQQQEPKVDKDVQAKAPKVHSSSAGKNRKYASSVRPLRCPLCPKTFLYEFARTQHMDHHRNKRKHSCHICKFKFKRKDHLKRHLRAIHQVDLEC